MTDIDGGHQPGEACTLVSGAKDRSATEHHDGASRKPRAPPKSYKANPRKMLTASRMHLRT
jgi:hypothetical protein